MGAVTQSEQVGFYRTMPVSLVMHAILLVLLVLLAVPRRLDPPVAHAVAVDIVSPSQFAALQSPQPAIEATAPPPAPILAAPEAARAPSLSQPAAPTPIAPAGGRTVQATDFYAAGVLADPANAEVRRNFGRLVSSEQLIQLCNIEALEQFGRDAPGPAPDTVVGYAFGDLAVDGATLIADGGAYRRQGQWFRVRYACTALPDMSGIAAFEYALGDGVPESEWEEHSLNADDKDMEP